MTFATTCLQNGIIECVLSVGQSILLLKVSRACENVLSFKTMYTSFGIDLYNEEHCSCLK